ncbi:hypothetical protein ACWD4N_35685, partial [Streptomyces sp. NPDC002586]
DVMACGPWEDSVASDREGGGVERGGRGRQPELPPSRRFAIGTFWTQVFDALNMGDNAVAALLVHSFTAVAGVTADCLVVDRIGVGFASAMSRVGAAIGTFLLPMGLNHFGARFVLPAGAAVLALGGLISHFLAPETTDLDLATAARTTP